MFQIRMLTSLALVVSLASTVTLGAAGVGSLASDQAAAAPVSITDAAPFIGDWILDVQGANGPAAINLTIKVDGEKVVGEISSDQMPLQPITDISKHEKSLVLNYSFDYQGTPVPCVVTLTPAGEKTGVDMDFANGAYQMSGTATKKVKAK